MEDREGDAVLYSKPLEPRFARWDENAQVDAVGVSARSVSVLRRA